MNHRFIRWGSLSAIAALFLIFTNACNKDNGITGSHPGPDQNSLSVYLTDGPGYFDKVLIDVQSVAIKIDTSAAWWPDTAENPRKRRLFSYCSNHDTSDAHAVWDTLQITPGIYNLLNFSNGADTLLAHNSIPKGRIMAFRITLGQNNSLVKDSVTYPLNLLHGWDKIYIRVSGASFQKISSGHYRIWIDMDAGRSIVKVHDGEFYLRPVMRAYAVWNTGRVRGRVIPFDAYPVISVYNNVDTLYAIPGRDGMFMVSGLPVGTYHVFINASNGYLSETISNISVSEGKATDIGTISLHK